MNIKRHLTGLRDFLRGYTDTDKAAMRRKLTAPDADIRREIARLPEAEFQAYLDADGPEYLDLVATRWQLSLGELQSRERLVDHIGAGN